MNSILKWEAWDKKGKDIMYHFVEDKEFLKKLKNTCSGIINELVQMINNEEALEVEAQDYIENHKG